MWINIISLQSCGAPTCTKRTMLTYLSAGACNWQALCSWQNSSHINVCLIYRISSTHQSWNHLYYLLYLNEILGFTEAIIILCIVVYLLKSIRFVTGKLSFYDRCIAFCLHFVLKKVSIEISWLYSSSLWFVLSLWEWNDLHVTVRHLRFSINVAVRYT